MRARIYFWIFVAIVILLLASCRSVRYVPVETVRTDSVYITVHDRDSIHVRDSVHVREKGDTVLVDKWHTIYRDRIRTDTMYSTRTDSVQVPYPVEKELTRWQRVRMDLGLVSTGAAIALAVAVVWIVRRKGGRR